MLRAPDPRWWLVLVCLLGGCTSSLARYEFAEPMMGTTFRIVLYADHPQRAESAAKAAFARLAELNAILSDYDPNSELSRLSNASQMGPTGPIAVSDDLWRVLEAAQTMSQRSDGAFDVTVGPYVRLWRRERRQGVLPRPRRLAEARAAVGYRHLQLDPQERTVRLLVPNMRLDLGGIAKGYAVDEALACLKQRGIEHALVDGGGDVAVSSPPPDRDGWRIALQSLDAANAPAMGYLRGSHLAVATSGDTYNYIEIDGVRYSHIIDPATGLGLTDRIGVTVVARDCMTADALASAVSVLGVERGLALVEATPDAAARIVTTDDHGEGRVHESKRFGGLPIERGGKAEPVQ